MPGGTDGRQGAVAEAFDRGGEATDVDVGLGAQRLAVTPLPHLRHRRRHQRQRGVVAGDVGGDHRHQLRFDGAAGAPGRLDDDPPQLLVARRADEHLGVLDQLGERARRRQRAELIRTDHEDDANVDGRVEHEVEQAAGDRVGRTGREHLLELVDDEQLPAGLVEAGDGLDRRQQVGPGHDHVRPPRTFAGQPTTADQREQTGPHER